MPTEFRNLILLAKTDESLNASSFISPGLHSNWCVAGLDMMKQMHSDIIIEYKLQPT